MSRDDALGDEGIGKMDAGPTVGWLTYKNSKSTFFGAW